MPNTQISNKKLKAIVFTDIVDFTKLSAEDEQHALNLIDKQRNIVKPIVEKHNGEWLKEIGDGLLFSFDSSLDAVNCSIEIQQSLQEIDDFKIRIGIHQGDIFVKDGDVFGDDVNIASRVEGFAPEGGIAISDKINKDISGVKDIKTSFIGHRKLKGVEQETQIRTITSHSLPKHKINILPRLAYYMSFVFGTFLLIFTPILGVLIFSQGGLDSKVEHVTVQDLLIDFMKEGIILLLLGYTCLSYVKGISYKAQKVLVYFTYCYTFYFLMTEFVLEAFEEGKEGHIYIFGLLLLSMIIVSGILYLNKKKNKK